MFPLLRFPPELVEMVIAYAPESFAILSRDFRALALRHIFAGCLDLNPHHFSKRKGRSFSLPREILDLNPALAGFIRSVSARNILPPPGHPEEVDVLEVLSRLHSLCSIELAIDLGTSHGPAPYRAAERYTRDVSVAIDRLFRVLSSLPHLRTMELELQAGGEPLAQRAPPPLRGLRNLDLYWYDESEPRTATSPPIGTHPASTSPTLLRIVGPSLSSLEHLRLHIPRATRLLIPDLAAADLRELRLELDGGTHSHVYDVCRTFPRLCKLTLCFGTHEIPFPWQDSYIGSLAQLTQLVCFRTNFDLDYSSRDPPNLELELDDAGFRLWDWRSLARQRAKVEVLARTLANLGIISWSRPGLEEKLLDEPDFGAAAHPDTYIVQHRQGGGVCFERCAWRDLVEGDFREL